MKNPCFKKLMAIEFIILYALLQVVVIYGDEESKGYPFSPGMLRKIGWSCYFTAVVLIMLHGVASATTEIPDGRNEHFKASILIGCPLGMVMVKITGETVRTLNLVVKTVAKPFLRNKFMYCFGVVSLIVAIMTGYSLFTYYDGCRYLAIFGNCFAQFVSGDGLCIAAQNIMKTEEGFYATQIIFVVLAFFGLGYVTYAIVALCVTKREALSDEVDRQNVTAYARTLLPLYRRRNRFTPVRYCKCAENRKSKAGALLTTSTQSHLTKAALSRMFVGETAQLHAPYLTKDSLSKIVKKTANPDTPYLTKTGLSQKFIEKMPQPHRLCFKTALPKETVHQPHPTKAALSQPFTEKIPL